MDLKSKIRTIPDYPATGIQFRDIMTLMEDAEAFSHAVRAMADPWRGHGVVKVAGIDARGFILAGAIAVTLGAGFVALRKPGKLPWRTLSEAYALEYGTDELHLHEGAVGAGERLLLVDDLIATGGTAVAGLNLLRRAGADVIGAAFLVDLPELGGAARLQGLGCPVEALVAFEGH